MGSSPVTSQKISITILHKASVDGPDAGADADDTGIGAAFGAPNLLFK